MEARMNLSFLVVSWWGLAGGIIWSFALGMLWYSPKLFFPTWQKAEGISDEELKSSKAVTAMVVGLIANSLSVYALALVLKLTGVSSVASGVGVSALISLGLVTASEINNGAFRMTKPVVFFIDGAYRLLMYIGAGALLSL